ncbi:hypothetical protein [Franconibacter helveticus]|uniref:hypothetical protein n=1 Tax=Franconibacter helveticus TaxID=357240 RepID=UPI00128D721F|nr:hypothetical protein [Franconibacter helveticus]
MTVRLRCKTLLNPGERLVYNTAPWKRLHKKQVSAAADALQSSSNCSKIPHHFEISWRFDASSKPN